MATYPPPGPAPWTTPAAPPPYPFYSYPRRADFSAIFGDTFQVYGSNFVAFFLVYLALGAIVSTFSVLMTAWMQSLIAGVIPTDPTTIPDFTSVMSALYTSLLVVFLAGFVTFVIASVVAGGMTYFAVQRHRGAVVTLSQALSAGFHRILAVIGATILEALVVVSPLIAGALLMVLGVASLNFALIGVGGMLILVGGILAIWLGIALSLIIPAVMMENRDPVGSLRRSWELTKGHWWSIFGVFVVFALLSLVINAVAGLPAGLANNLAVTIVANTIVYGFTGSWLVIAAAVAYDLIVKERQPVFPSWPYTAPPIWPAPPAAPPSPPPSEPVPPPSGP